MSGWLLDFLYLGSHEGRSVTRGHQQAVVGSELFGETKVTYPDAFWEPAVIHVADIARLQVSMHDLEGTNGTQGVLGSVEVLYSGTTPEDKGIIHDK